MTSSARPSEPLTFRCGQVLPNRLMLAPMTNCQSHADGRLSEDEYRWLTMRAEGGFGLTMTCAAHVLEQGQGFGGQLGIFSDDHLEGLTRLADGLRAAALLACCPCLICFSKYAINHSLVTCRSSLLYIRQSFNQCASL